MYQVEVLTLHTYLEINHHVPLRIASVYGLSSYGSLFI